MCIKCCVEKEPGGFAIKSGRRETAVRREKICKACRASALRESRLIKKDRSLRSAAKRTVGSTSTVPKTEKCNGTLSRETSKIASLLRVGHNDVGPSKTVVAAHDEVQRFNEFVSILRQGYEDLEGVSVYVRKIE